MPDARIPLCVAPAQFKALTTAAGDTTVLLNAQLFPPMLIAKLAVPFAEGVPVMVYVSEPAPFATVPAVRVAVKPVTKAALGKILKKGKFSTSPSSPFRQIQQVELQKEPESGRAFIFLVGQPRIELGTIALRGRCSTS